MRFAACSGKGGESTADWAEVRIAFCGSGFHGDAAAANRDFDESAEVPLPCNLTDAVKTLQFGQFDSEGQA